VQGDVELSFFCASAVIGEVEAFVQQRVDVGGPVLAPAFLGAALLLFANAFSAYATAAALTVLTYVVANSRLTLLSLTAVRNGVLVALTVAALRSLAIKPT